MLLTLLLLSPPGGMLYDIEAGFLLNGADTTSSKGTDPPPIAPAEWDPAGPCWGKGGGTTKPPEVPADGFGGWKNNVLAWVQRMH